MSDPRPIDVREALIAAAERLIEEDGEVSLRACARLAGVSHAAPAHWFPSKAHLVAAALARAFDAFADRMIAARAAAPDEPFERLKAIGLAYIAFALERPNTYGAMFATPPPDGPDGELARAGERAGAVLAETVAATERPGGLDVETGVTFAWMNVHGFVSLLAAQRVACGEAPDAPMVLAERLLSLLAPAFRR